MRRTRVVFADAAIVSAFRELRRADSANHHDLARAIGTAVDELRRRADEGRVLEGGQIPEYYRQKHRLDRLRRLDIPPHWRVFYTIHPDRIIIIDLTCDGFNEK